MKRERGIGKETKNKMSAIGAGAKAVVLPMSRLDAEQLPEQLRQMFLGYIAPLNKAIEMLLQQKQTASEEDFEQNFQNVKHEYMKYYTTIVADIKEGELGLLLQRSFSSQPIQVSLGTPAPAPAQVETRTQVEIEEELTLTPLEQTLNNAAAVTARVTRLLLEPACQDYVVSHPDALEPCKELNVYATILIYIQQQQQQTKTDTSVDQYIVEKIMQKCREFTRNIEDFVNTISLKVSLDPELTAALEHFANQV